MSKRRIFLLPHLTPQWVTGLKKKERKEEKKPEFEKEKKKKRKKNK